MSDTPTPISERWPDDSDLPVWWMVRSDNPEFKGGEEATPTHWQACTEKMKPKPLPYSPKAVDAEIEDGLTTLSPAAQAVRGSVRDETSSGEVSFDPEPTPLPLWRVMEQAYFNGLNPGFVDHLGYAAEIEALRNWLLPEEPYCNEDNTMNEYMLRNERQRLRALLTEQARIARGDA